MGMTHPQESFTYSRSPEPRGIDPGTQMAEEAAENCTGMLQGAQSGMSVEMANVRSGQPGNQGLAGAAGVQTAGGHVASAGRGACSFPVTDDNQDIARSEREKDRRRIVYLEHAVNTSLKHQQRLMHVAHAATMNAARPKAKVRRASRAR